ncbi:MAG: hypothetical protein MJ219_01815 [Mycoplasmoidaceae bacterium]|nr:hypothetical protein [Mycoplasmoidaceae bacterium]
MLGAIMTLVMLIVFVLVSCIPSSIEMYKEKKAAMIAKMDKKIAQRSVKRN